jgi:DNA (cytosine-5)-methyltransferase 1
LKKLFTFCSFFAGIGGFDLGFERSGMKSVFQCELNPFRRKVLEKNFPNVILKSNIQDVTFKDIPKADLWCGGFPCQDLSLANQGKRKGLIGERSGLFFEFFRLLENKKPKWIVLENVPGLLNSNSGKDFKSLISPLDELGYGLAWRVLDAKYFGTPQRRRRVFIVGSYRSMESARVLFEPNGNYFTTKSGLGKGEGIRQRSRTSNGLPITYAIQHAGINRKPSAGPQAKGYRSDGETYTLDSRGSSDAVCSPNDGYRIRNTTRLSSELDSNRLRASGDAVCVFVANWLGNRILNVDNNSFS